MRALGYLRVSTEDQATEGFSLPEQEREIREYCARLDYQVVEIVADDGVSGRLSERPALRRLLDLAEAGAYDVMVAKQIDRLGRGVRVILNTLHEIRGRGVRVELTRLKLEDSPEGRLAETIHAGFAEFEWEQIRRRLMAGKVGKARDRRVMPGGRPPFGYRHISVAQADVLPECAGRDGELVIEESEARWVRELFSRYLAGESPRQLAMLLNENGILTRRGSRWSQSRVRDTLMQPAYKGQRFYGQVRHEKVDDPPPGQKKNRITPRLPSDWIEMACPPLVEAATWEAVQQRLAERATAPGRPSDEFLLQGHVHCGKCRAANGEALRCHGQRRGHAKGTPSHGLRYYRCQSSSRAELDYCRSHYPAEKLETLAWRETKKALEPGAMGALARTRAEESLRNAAGDPDFARMESEAAAAEAEEERLLELALQGFSEAAIRKKLEPLQARRQSLLRTLSAARSRANVQTPDEAEKAAEARAAGYREQLAGAEESPPARKRLMAELIRTTIQFGKKPQFEIVIPTGVPGRDF